ncbi:MAG: hypothetical protein EAZ55_14765 [Cytophagales bacterium]|nr:MAG: hypothetical protein EAZ55_14765 [Cytophagales bacterium]
MNENEQENAASSNPENSENKINVFRELIMGPEKKEMEAQIKGMRDLFISLLNENKKEYELQINDIKRIFTNVLEENRKDFQLQVQSLQTTLPQILGNSLRQRGSEEHLYLTDLDQKSIQGSYTRVEAIEEIVVGSDIRTILEQVDLLQKEVNGRMDEGKKQLQQLTNTIGEELKKAEQRIANKLQELTQWSNDKIKQLDKKQSEKIRAAALLKEMAEKIKI